MADILALSDRQAAAEYRRVLHDFRDRHWLIEQVFDQRFEHVEAMLDMPEQSLTRAQRRLIGAYFCHEYTYAAAAIMNPSIVPHPDQSGMDGGSCRFVMSLRTVGEGHISTIKFREGIAYPDGRLDLWPEGPVAIAAEGVEQDGADTVLVRRHPDANLSNTVIFPVTEAQRGGLEDLRLTRLVAADGSFEWVGTYTAYSGSQIRSELMRTRDFRDFELRPVIGRAGRNKGMALFPAQIDGQYVMIGRQDGKNMYLLRSDDLTTWDDDGVLLMEPRYPWELIQIGNCGSPILTDHGWLMLTHGVGAMRKYALGCVLLDKDDPSRVLARSREPILTAENADRSGYVPNVVYSCGMLLVGEQLHIPYGISDSAVGFATMALPDLLATME
ncbi:MAG: glycoside hydrolase family 130 protein [Alteraurantiacibacter sp.]